MRNCTKVTHNLQTPNMTGYGLTFRPTLMLDQKGAIKETRLVFNQMANFRNGLRPRLPATSHVQVIVDQKNSPEFKLTNYGSYNKHNVVLSNHLGAKIPNYFLEKCHNEIEFFRRIKPVTFWGSFKCFTYRLYDEDAGKLVGFAAAK